MENKILLSIIIPTKNRQFTCLYAIESALSNNKNDIEVIVQDCSDTNMLQQQIFEKFGNDNRIQYQYSDAKPSMTDNWNNAFRRASGEYLCGIGDDDAVLPKIYEVADWAKSKNILAVTQKKFVIYTWPGFIPQPYNGTLGIDSDYSGEYTIVNNLEERVIEYSKLTDPMAYINLPQAYHCIFSRQIKNKLESTSGEFLKSTSLDIYTAVAFNKFITSYAEADFPFTIRGACKSSNSQRLYNGTNKEHFKEFKKLEYPEFLPDTVGLNVTVAESFIKACENTGQGYLRKNIDLPVLYANIALEDEANFKLCEEKLKEYVPEAKDWERFYKHYQSTKKKEIAARRKETLFTFLKKGIPIIYKLYRKILPLKVSRTVVHAETIKDALFFLAKG